MTLQEELLKKRREERAIRLKTAKEDSEEKEKQITEASKLKKQNLKDQFQNLEHQLNLPH